MSHAEGNVTEQVIITLEVCIISNFATHPFIYGLVFGAFDVIVLTVQSWHNVITGRNGVIVGDDPVGSKLANATADDQD